MENFNLLGLPPALLESLKVIEFNTPTPIQAQTIPIALEGKDILGSAQTGTGKTGAFGIPLVAYLLNNVDKTALILTPTRELALQVSDTLKLFLGKKTNVKAALLIGGDSMLKQLAQLKAKPRLIVGTPGRVNDHLVRGTLKLNNTGFLVLDETDRMLDMGFEVQLQKISKCLPEVRQTLMLSATISPTIVKLASNYLKDPVRVSIAGEAFPIDKIKQEIVKTTEAEKVGILLDKLNQFPGPVIVFVKTKIGSEKLADKLCEYGHSADAIHGDLRQRNREQVIKSFRSGRTRVLVATDVAARGLDIPNIECVVNYDLPSQPEDYIHRIGRTGRAGASGIAVNFITPSDSGKWKDICKLIKHPDTADFTRTSENTPSRNSRSRGNGNGRGSRGRSGNHKGSSFFGSSKGRSDSAERGQRTERSGAERGQRTERSDRPDRGDRGPRVERSDRPERSDRGPRTERNQRNDRVGKDNASGRKTDAGKRPFFGKPRSNRSRNSNNAA